MSAPGKMRILFTTNHIDMPSTMLNADRLKLLNNIDGVSIDFYNRNYAEYDVVLFMGYAPAIEEARAANPKLKIGIIDPRPEFNKHYIGMDFILANGIEMKDWYLKVTPHIFIYYIYPELLRKVKLHQTSKKIIVGYHGNKFHLRKMNPRITSALERLADDYEVELWAMYNITNLGEWSIGLPDSRKVKVKHIQWSEEHYETHLSKVDIGLVPNLTPISEDIERVFLQSTRHENRSSALRRFFKNRRKKCTANNVNLYNEYPTDYLIRYKSTSNPGRIFVFAQYGIPVVADMFPSALQVIDDGINGFVCYSTDAWYWALKKLADNPAMRAEFAQKMMKKFDKIAAPEVLNENLLKFIKSI